MKAWHFIENAYPYLPPADDYESIRVSLPNRLYDPRKGETFRERLDLKGNPSVKTDWYVNPKTKETFDFIGFARGEGRFAKHFAKDGSPSSMLLAAQADRLANWKQLQDLAGVTRE